SGGILTSSVGFSFDLHERLALQSDGKILFLSLTGIQRFNPDGTVDASFGTGGTAGLGGTGWVVATMTGSGMNAMDLGIDPEGRILVVGQVNLGSYHQLARLLPNASTDPHFANNAFTSLLPG